MLHPLHATPPTGSREQIFDVALITRERGCKCHQVPLWKNCSKFILIKSHESCLDNIYRPLKMINVHVFILMQDEALLEVFGWMVAINPLGQVISASSLCQ